MIYFGPVKKRTLPFDIAQPVRRPSAGLGYAGIRLGGVPAPQSGLQTTLRNLQSGINDPTIASQNPAINPTTGALITGGITGGPTMNQTGALIPTFAPNVCILWPPTNPLASASQIAQPPITIGTCSWDHVNWCNTAAVPGAYVSSARNALNQLFQGRMPRQGIFVGTTAAGPGANAGALAYLQSILPEFPWTITPAPNQIQAFIRPSVSSSQVINNTVPKTVPIAMWLLFPSDAIPATFYDPAHPPFDQNDVAYGVPNAATIAAIQGGTQPINGRLAQMLAGAMYMFFPGGYYDFGGSTPGAVHQGHVVGSYFASTTGQAQPIAYWARTVSDEMINFMVQFLTTPNPYDGTVGFGGVATNHVTAAGVALSTLIGGAKGMQVGQAVGNALTPSAAAAQSAAAGSRAAGAGAAAAAGMVPGGSVAASVGASAGSTAATAAALGAAAGPEGAAIGAAAGALISLVSGLWSYFSDPDPPGWVKQLSKMQGLQRQTSAWYWIGETTPDGAAIPQAQLGWCNRLLPSVYRGLQPIDPSLAFGSSTWPLTWKDPIQLGLAPVNDYAIFLPRGFQGDTQPNLWTPIDAYTEVLRRIGGGGAATATSSIPWPWIAAGLGILAAIGIGVAVARKPDQKAA